MKNLLVSGFHTGALLCFLSEILNKLAAARGEKIDGFLATLGACAQEEASRRQPEDA